MGLNIELSDLFAELATLMELKGENAFKVIAFAKVSRILRETSVNLRKSVEDGTIGQIEGIGKSSAAIIDEYVRTGKSAVHDEISAEIPSGLPPLLQIEGMGPKTLHMLWKERGITSLEQLEAALAGGKLHGLKGIGVKKIEAIGKGIESLKRRTGAEGTVVLRRPLGEAWPVARDLLEQVRRIPGVLRAEIAGSLRRCKETIGDVDIVAAIAAPSAGAEITRRFVALPDVADVLAKGATKASIKTAGGLQVDLRMVPAGHFGAALMYFTGSKEHNVRIRGLAQKQGYTLNEWGLYRLDEYEKSDKKTGLPPDARPVAAETEQDIFRALGLAYVEPELREDRGEIELAMAGELPRLVTCVDIRGDLHTHTVASDGANTIEEMAQAAMATGYEYLAITDHSKAMVQANGLSPERLLAHVADIHRIGSRLKGITLLAGTEVDILADGRLDYEDDILAELDIVIASPHISLRQEPARATDRLLRAVEHKYVNVIGHPTGRIINRREGLAPDFARLFAAAAACGTAMEINASWPRLDLDDVHARAAAAAGAMFAINTDAHATGELEQVRYGLGVARRAALTPDKIVNSRSLAALRDFLGRKR
ncbi:MAG: DNA polymerase/3'-5' exonuclease PolX [Tepidisphaeraceae bacterium]|jgi:DNA polymerase (family 10)